MSGEVLTKCNKMGLKSLVRLTKLIFSLSHFPIQIFLRFNGDRFRLEVVFRKRNQKSWNPNRHLLPKMSFSRKLFKSSSRGPSNKPKLVILIRYLFVFYGPIPASFCLFTSFSHYNFNNTNWKSLDGVLGIWTLGHRMVGADKTTEL